MNLDLESLGLRWRQMRFNPLRSLTPERLAAALDQFEAGWLREAALIFETIEKREFMIGSVMRKRRAAVARRDWQIIVPDENDPRAEAHKATLEHFYNNLTVTDATDLNVRTGMSGLVRQMMNAELQKYAVHEIVWQPGPDGLTAELRHVPLYFFENRTGKLKFVGVENRADGMPLEEGGWMVTVGSGLGEALSILYMFKRLGVQDLIAFSEKFSVPGVLGRTSAPKDSDAGKAMRDSVLSYAADWIGITYNDDGAIKSPIEIMQTPSSGTLPQMSIIEYMDRGMAVLVRGGDLSTISRGDGTGSNPQQDELDALLQDDCAMISETLQTQLDRLVIRMVHGDENPAAYIVINPPSDEDLARELTIDTGLFGLGVKQDPADLAERYGREMAKEVVSVQSAVISGNAVESPEGLEGLKDLLSQSYADVAAVIVQALNAEGAERKRLLEEAAAMLPDQVGDDALDDAITEMLAQAFLGDDTVEAENAARHNPQPKGWGGRFVSGKSGNFREPRTRAYSDQFGPIPTKDARLDIAQQKDRAHKAMSFVMSTQGSAPRAVIRQDVGEINFDYGDPDKKTGWGLSHLKNKHPDAWSRIPETLIEGQAFYHPDDYSKRMIVKGELMIVIKAKDNRHSWVISGFVDPKTIGKLKPWRKNQDG